jgi:signal transduction histidine kinase
VPRIFDRFYQGDRPRTRGGNGLGLSIVRAIAEALGGSADVLSPAGGGLQAVVRIPLSGLTPYRPAPQPQPSAQVR